MTFLAARTLAARVSLAAVFRTAGGAKLGDSPRVTETIVALGINRRLAALVGLQRRPWRLIFSASLLSVLGLAVVMAGPARAMAGPSPTANRAANRVARHLATRRSVNGREQALKAAARLLNAVPLSSAGKLAGRSASAQPLAVPLFDFEIRSLARRLLADQLVTADQLAAALNAKGVRVRGNKLTARQLMGAINALERYASTHSHEPQSFPLILMAARGHIHSGGRPVPNLGATAFDPVQLWLLTSVLIELRSHQSRGTKPRTWRRPGPSRALRARVSSSPS
jgi:hypothetical protein